MTKQPIHTLKNKVIILASSRDFGRCPIATRLSTAMWPVAGKPVLMRLFDNLASQGINNVTISSNGESSFLRESIKDYNQLAVDFLDEPLPVGTAGAIRDASRGNRDDLILVLPANIVAPPAIDAIISAHYKDNADLTVIFEPANNNSKLSGQAVGIYLCNSSIIKYIPKDGYFDIKEGLIPALVRADRTVRAVTLPSRTGVFNNHKNYLDAVSIFLTNTQNIKEDFTLCMHNSNQGIWESGKVTIDSDVRILGPVTIMDGTHISKNAIIIGPTAIGRNVTIKEGTYVANSAIWDGTNIGKNCQINRCVFDYNAMIKNGTCVEEKAIKFKPERKMNKVIRKVFQYNDKNTSRPIQILQQQLKIITQKIGIGQHYGNKGLFVSLGVALIILAFLWSYWPGLVDIWSIWQRSDEYSSGLLVPFLAVYILWSKREKIRGTPIRPCIWGILAFIFAQGVRFFGLFFMYGSAERLSIVLSIAALVLMLFGWKLFKKVATILLYLCLMLPWPNMIQSFVALPMQRWATSSAVFCLEMLGYAVVREGNIIHIGQATVAVAEACNGLRMVMAFFVITGLVVLLANRNLWEKIIVLISSLPIALLCNTIRLTLTAIAFTFVSGDDWEKIFHDFGGYAMMPMALAAVVGEFWLLKKLTTVTEEPTSPITVKKVKTER